MHATVSIEVGYKAPDFKLRGPGGQFVSLSEYRDKKNVVLVFYPLAFSPVCSHQLPDIQKRFRGFEDLDAVVLGISVDSWHANEAFAHKLGLSFPLLSDFQREISAAYGVLNAEKGYSGRAVFVVDRQGRVAYRDVSPAPGDLEQAPDVDRVFEALEALA